MLCSSYVQSENNKSQNHDTRSMFSPPSNFGHYILTAGHFLPAACILSVCKCSSLLKCVQQVHLTNAVGCHSTNDPPMTRSTLNNTMITIFRSSKQICDVQINRDSSDYLGNSYFCYWIFCIVSNESKYGCCIR